MPLASTYYRHTLEGLAVALLLLGAYFLWLTLRGPGRNGYALGAVLCFFAGVVFLLAGLHTHH